MNKLHKISTLSIVLITLLYIIGIANAIPVEEWKKTYGSTKDDIFYSVVQTSDGGYVSVGGTSSYGAGNKDIWLVKTDSSGNKLWSKTFGGVYYDEAYSVQQTNDGGYILAGFSNKSGQNDALLIKTDSSGNKKWSKTFGGTKEDGFSSAKQTRDGGYIISGHTKSYATGYGYDEQWIVKTGSSGITEWSKTYAGVGSGYAYDVLQTRDGGYIFVGTYGPIGGIVMKIDSNGKEKWRSTFMGSGDIYVAINSIVEVSDGYVVAGLEEDYPDDPPYLYVSGLLGKIDNNGNIIWQKRINDRPITSLQYAKDGEYVIAGYTRTGIDDANYNGWLMKTDKNGNEKWNKIFGGAKHDEINSVKRTKDGGYILAGYTKSSGSGNKDGWLIKIVDSPTGITVASPNGGESWVRGSTKLITWTYSGSPGANVRIQLYKGSSLVRTISSGTPNDGSFSWSIPWTQAIGNDYKIKISSTTATYNDWSNGNFRIY